MSTNTCDMLLVENSDPCLPRTPEHDVARAPEAAECPDKNVAAETIRGELLDSSGAFYPVTPVQQIPEINEPLTPGPSSRNTPLTPGPSPRGGEREAKEVRQTGQRGRPAVMDEKMKDTAFTLLSVGLSRRQAAAYLGIATTTISNTMERDEDFAARVERAEEMSVATPLITIAHASQKNWRAAVWLLTRNEQRLAQMAAAAKGPPTEEERQAAHQERLRQARETKEISDAMLGRPSATAPLNYDLCQAVLDGKNCSPATRAELQKLKEIVFRMKQAELGDVFEEYEREWEKNGGSPINYTLANQGFESASPTAAEQAEMDKVATIVKQVAEDPVHWEDDEDADDEDPDDEDADDEWGEDEKEDWE